MRVEPGHTRNKPHLPTEARFGARGLYVQSIRGVLRSTERQRWNRLGARWFREHTFVLARHLSLTPALFALFAVNGAMHVYLIAAAVSARWMLLCAAFFLMQPVLILFERSLQIRRWTPLAARVWTITTLILLFPLVLAPFLTALRIRL